MVFLEVGDTIIHADSMDAEFEKELEDMLDNVNFALSDSHTTSPSVAPLYLKNRPPPIHFAPHQEGSTWPNDVPMSRDDVGDYCWMDITGKVHVTVPYASEDDYPYPLESAAVAVTIPHAYKLKIYTILFVACLNKHKTFVTLHGINQQTDEYNVMGDYVWCSEDSNLMEMRNESKPLVLMFAPIAPVNRPAKIDVTDSPSFKRRKRAYEYDCCIGCATGQECHNLNNLYAML